MVCRGIKGEFDFLREEFQKTVLVCPTLHCSSKNIDRIRSHDRLQLARLVSSLLILMSIFQTI